MRRLLLLTAFGVAIAAIVLAGARLSVPGATVADGAGSGAPVAGASAGAATSGVLPTPTIGPAASAGPSNAAASVPAGLAGAAPEQPSPASALPRTGLGAASGAGPGAGNASAADATAPFADLGPRVRGAERAVLPPADLTGYVSPLPRGRVTLPFGPTPWGGSLVDGQVFHDGVDLATVCGDRIVAAHAGTVLAASRQFDEFIGWRGDLGPYEARLDTKHLWWTLPIVIVIDDGNGYRSIYAHFWKTVVKPGQVVKAGQLIGYEGATGRATGCHLHYGLFNPREPSTFQIDPAVAKRMKLPLEQTARVDPLLVIPVRSSPAKPASPTSHTPRDQ